MQKSAFLDKKTHFSQKLRVVEQNGFHHLIENPKVGLETIEKGIRRQAFTFKKSKGQKQHFFTQKTLFVLKTKSRKANWISSFDGVSTIELQNKYLV